MDKVKRYGTGNVDISTTLPVETTKERFGCRHVFALTSFLGLAAVYMSRVNLSVAIVHMVRFKSHNESSNSFYGEDDYCPSPGNSSTHHGDSSNGEFDWDGRVQGLILGSFFWGYIATQIPAGILAEKYSGKHVFGLGIFLASLFTLFTPLAARYSANALIIMRVLIGLSEGMTLPAMHTLMSKWVPDSETSTIGSFIMSGMQFGTVVAIPLSGFLCALELDNGWPLAFYVPGALGVIWFVCWYALIYESPRDHPRISDDEKRFICGSTSVHLPARKLSTPWSAIALSLPVWAILIAHMGKAFGFNVLLTELPTYMKTVLHFDLKSDTLLSALPYLAMWIFSIGFSLVADGLRKDLLSTTTTRKLFNSIGFLLPAVALVGASFTGCDRIATVALITLATGFNGAVYSGYQINHIDVASNYAGVLMGITNCVANICGFLAPYVVSLVVTHTGSLHQWQMVFFITALVYVVTSLFYVVFATGKEQPWNRPPDDEQAIILPTSSSKN